MEFKFKANIFKNDPSQNKNNNPKYPTHSGSMDLPVSKLQEFVDFLHWASRTDLKFNDHFNEKVIPIKISGWTAESERTNKKYLTLYFEPPVKTKQEAQEAKEAQAVASHAETLQQSSGACSVNTAAANLAQGTGGTVVEKTEEDIF